jgi:hypothetical protein
MPCPVCREVFTRAEGEHVASVCPKCRAPAAATVVAEPVEAKVRLPLPDKPRVEPRREPSKRRIAPIHRSRSRVGLALAVIAMATCLAGVALVVARRDKEPTERYLADVKSESAEFVVAPPHEGVTKIDTVLNLSILHQGTREAVGTRIEDLMRLEQRSKQTAEVAWTRDAESGVELSSETDCRLESQSGSAPGGDAGERRAYPWDGFHGSVRVLVPASGLMSIVGSGPPVAGRDVPACLTLREVGAPSGAVEPGTTWHARIVLPLLATREGVVFPAGFPCDVKYVGHREIGGVASYALSIVGAAPSVMPTELEDMNHVSGTLHGALFFDAATGLLVEAHVTIDAAASLEHTNVEDRVHVSGKLDARRR